MMKLLYLVMISHDMDDIPLRIYEDEQKAIAFAESYQPGSDIEKRWNCEATTPMHCKIVTMGKVENGVRELTGDVICCADFSANPD